jgi:hypothetical protein
MGWNEMNEFLPGDKLQVNENGEMVLVSRPGWICDGTYPELIDNVNPNVHVLFNDGTEGVGFYSVVFPKWYIFIGENKQLAIEDYRYNIGSIEVHPSAKPIGWKLIEKPAEAQVPMLKLWDRVYHENYGYGTVAYIDNDDKFLPYTVVFDNEHGELHQAISTIDNGPENRCYWCTTRLNDMAKIRLADTNTGEEVIPSKKYEIGDRVTSERFGKGTIVKLDGDEGFMVVYDVAAGVLWGDGELQNRCRWEQEDTL